MKTFERIIKSRLIWWLQEREIWPKSQFGFRRFFSTTDAVLNLTTDIQTAFSKNKSVSIIKLIYSLYSNRRVCLRVNDSCLPFQTSNRGLPQGTAMSPLLYVLFTKELENILPDNVNIIQYADDVCLYTIDNSIQNCINSLDKTMQSVDRWMTDNGVDR